MPSALRAPIPARTYCQFTVRRYSLSNKGQQVDAGPPSASGRPPAQRAPTSALPRARPVSPCHTGMAPSPFHRPSTARPGPVPPARPRFWSRTVAGDGAQPASHPPAVYGSLTCLNAAAGTEITRAYVTHCEDYRDLANGRTTGIYSFRDLYTAALASIKDRICRFPSVFALNDLRVRRALRVGHPDTTFLSYFRVIKSIVFTTHRQCGPGGS